MDMSKRVSALGIFLLTGLLSLALGAPAHGDIRFKDGHWRLELSGAVGVHQRRDRTGDRMVTGIVEYEFPATARATLGLRLLPLFVYDEDDDDTILGAGFGVGARLYQKKNEYRGLFAEVEANTLIHESRIERNSSNIDFLIGFGVGYQFKSDWHAVAQYRHISNAGLEDKNSGANALGIGIGYRF